MKEFARLFSAIDETTKTTRKVSALADYFGTAPEQDRVWTIALFTGRRPKRVITTTQLREWAAEMAGLPLWLFEECYPIVGDLAETITHLLPPPGHISDLGLSSWIDRLREAYGLDLDARKAFVLDAWDQLDNTQRFLFNKLITGGFRVGVSRNLVTRALAQATDRERSDIEYRLMGQWRAENTSWAQLVERDDPTTDLSRPYPFYLAHQLPEDPESLGPATDWRAEWKWDGIRGQLILREGQHFVWSRGEELMTDRFPELAAAADFLPRGVVLDGEILAWDKTMERPLPFGDLQKRVGRKSVPKKLRDEVPVLLNSYDLLELDGRDMRALPFDERRADLTSLLADLPSHAPLRMSASLSFDNWSDLARTRETAREVRAEGVMLKHAQSPYRAGRKRGDWWKWKLDPLVVDAVMIYAQSGSGRRANLFTDFTFAVRNGNDLVPFAKAYSGLTDAEFREITNWVRRNTTERFGPVRQVRPELVFEIAFEGILKSTRHKSGISLRFPRMARWRRDKPVSEINTLDDLKELLTAHDQAAGPAPDQSP